MKTESFTNLIRAITGRPFSLFEKRNWNETALAGDELSCERLYFVGFDLPLSKRTVGFDWKTPKSDEKMLRSFITAFSSKFREPNPATYASGPYGGSDWKNMTAERREAAFYHHVGHMFSKEDLIAQVQSRFSCPEIENALNRWGFYETEYGIGIFCFWQTQFVVNAIAKMRSFLAGKGIAAHEEFSDARWVYRFRIETSREFHVSVLNEFNSATA